MAADLSGGWKRATRVIVPVALVALIFWIWRVTSAPDYSEETAPNIIVYMIDTLRPDELAPYGAAVTRTPAIDEFAAGATVFLNARSPAVSTRPAVASLLAGVSPFVHGIVENQGGLSDAFRLLPELLRARGYHTGALVANPNVREKLGFGRGFSIFKSLLPESWAWAADADWVVDEVRQFIDDAPADRPFFLFVLSIDPHQPYMPPAPFDALYDPGTAGGEAGSGANLRRIDDLFAAGRPVPPDELERILSLYRGEISFADAAFGDLIEVLEKNRLLDETLVVLTSDHGEAFGEHGNRGHSKTLFEETLRIPLILRHPKLFASGQRSENVDLLDLSATIAAMAGQTPPEHWTGRDLRTPRPDTGFFATNLQRREDELDFFTAVTIGDYKLIRNESKLSMELYHLNNDPHERQPLDRDKNMDTVLQLSRELKRFRDRSLVLRKRIIKNEIDPLDEEISEEMRQRLEALGYSE